MPTRPKRPSQTPSGHEQLAAFAEQFGLEAVFTPAGAN